MKKKSWAALMLVGVLSRLALINGGPTLHHQSRPMSASDEQQIERMYEMLDTHQKRTAAAAAVPPSARRDTRTDSDADGEAHRENLPKFHYEVHHVQHKFGHRTPAEVKLRDVARHAASVNGDDDDEDDDTVPAAAAAAGHVTSGETRDRPVLDAGGLLTEKKLGDYDDDDSSMSEPIETDLRDSVKNDYYQYEGGNGGGEETDSINGDGGAQSLARVASRSSNGAPSPISDVYFVAVVVGCSVAGLAGLLVAGVCWYRLHKKMKATSEVDYPAYGVTGPAQPANGKDGSPGDRKLAQSAQMYHYQHQKQQMIASERVSHEASTPHVEGGSDVESDDDNEDGDYTVFECRGLATNGEMEVRNPLFSGQHTPPDENASTSPAATAASQAKK